MRIRGAVLEEIGRTPNYADSKPLTICDLELDEPAGDEIRVRIECAGICHSDLSVVNGDRVRPVPMLLGHEAAGIVESVGDTVTELVPGDRVVMTFLPRCGECRGCRSNGLLPCTEGTASNTKGTLLSGQVRLHRGGEDVLHHLGVSGFATHAVVDKRSVVKVGADVPPEVAALLGCAVLTGGGAVLNLAKPEPGDTLMVVGLGGVGMAALLTARALGAEVIGIDANEEKLGQAQALGAAEAYTPAAAAELGITAPTVVEAAGNARAFEAAVALTEPGGTTITVGLPAPTALAQISPLTLVAEARTIIGSYLGSAVPSRDVPIFADLWRQGRLPVEKLVSARIPLEDINAAMDDLAAGRALRQIIHFDGE
ncbi:alcohol dehydrogenase catalytic domain-containing protein [Arthrobacter sp. 08Y14]|uniref:alcohol dehydrogenase catalytic domain-containing protein n=1 Tax=Arthrobacter sp. 08Y14 TaxID=2058885 RepID=UPI000CE31839|nr:alcohol dehydrogenase catalytic domain-containing protein [Arthrobacter sp. 08Y14]